MIYSFEKTFSSGGEENVYEEMIMKLDRGLVYQIDIDFPPGSCGLLYVRILEKGSQIYPVPRNSHFRGDNKTITFQDTRIIFLPPFDWCFQGYNLDTIYDHSCTVRIGLVSNIELIRRYVPDYELLVHEIISGYSERERLVEKEKAEKMIQIFKGVNI